MASIDYPADMDQNYTIAQCPAQQRADALRMLHVGLPADQQAALVHALDAVRQQDESVFAGLLIASESEALIGAAWAQLSSGRTAVLWPPAASSPAAIELMRAIATFLDQQQVALTQFLVSDDSQLDQDALAAADFEKLVSLAYLSVGSNSFPSSDPSRQLVFQPNAASEPGRLGNLLIRTYEGSLDCPRLNGVRASDDVLEGYRDQGTYAAERWFFVRHANQDVGTLILTEHPNSGNWELVYMGLVPEARGNGWGQEILDFAMYQAAVGHAERLVLAVDEANQHATAMYQLAGFTAWDFRSVYARLRTNL